MKTTHYEEILNGFMANFMVPEEGYITYVAKSGEVYKTPENYVEARIKGDFLTVYPDGTYKKWF